MKAACTGLLLIILPGLTGCGTVGYYAQAIRGQYHILHRQEPIARLLKNTNTAPVLRQRLELVLQLRNFAEQDLGLDANGHYLHYADLQRRFALWNVYATPEFSLEARSWWYPVVGRLEYQGYFDERKARQYAGRLAAKGYDVHVGGVPAYSTLGWFRDPVLNTFVFADDLELADTLFHELAHQRLFVAGDTDFNEAMATAVAEAGVEQWLRSTGNTAALASYQRAHAHKEQFVALVTGARDQLKKLYARAGGTARCTCVTPCGPDCVGQELRRRKEEALAGLRRDYEAMKQERWHGARDYDAWFGLPLNNALLNTVDTYYALVPGFRRMLAEAPGDWPRFYRAAEALAKLSKKQRHRRLTDGW